MELSGEEKKIRASFRELRLEDERVTPRFAVVWNRAHLSTRRQTALNFRLAAAAVIVCLAVFSLALLSRYWQRNPRSNYALANGAAKPAARPAPSKKDRELVQKDEHPQVVRRPGPESFAPRHQTAKLVARRSTTRDAIALSRWQSPTTSLLRLPGDEVLKAFPQVNRTLREMESFLPNRTN
ncbi:MAG: hypothetical protein ACREA9_07100 [Pyrinomonadaceae bacterium]